MKNYLTLLEEILLEGVERDDRTGTGTLSLFSKSLKFDLDKGFPIVTTKFVNYNAVLAELLWFITGSTNINDFNSKIWNEWATEDGEIGPMYGTQWRNWNGLNIDQLANVIEDIKNNPFSRRHVVSAWNVEVLPSEKRTPQENVELKYMALAPCHHFYQFWVNKNELNLHFSMRSVDTFLGMPFNIASYATLLMMVAQLTGLKPKLLSFHGVDVHLYKNHLEQANTQLDRKPYVLPELMIDESVKHINDFKKEHFMLCEYTHHPRLEGKISV